MYILCLMNRLIHNKLLLIVISALLYSGAFLAPTHADWFIFIFLIPLLYAAFLARGIVPFTYGFLWGTISNVSIFYGIVILLIEHAQGPGRITAYFFLTVFCAVYAGLWFSTASMLTLWISSYTKSILPIVALWAFITTLYFLWMRYAALSLFFGCWQGNPLSWPLLPLVAHAGWLQCFSWCHEWLLLFFLCMSSACIAASLAYDKKYGAGVFLLLPFFSGWFADKTVDETPSMAKKMGWIIPSPATRHNRCERTQEIILQYLLLVQKNVTYIITPESAFPFDNNYNSLITVLNEYMDDQSVFIMSVHRTEDKKLYNTLLISKCGRIIQHYDKSNLMPFAEYLPPLFSSSTYCKNLFLADTVPFCHGTNERTTIECDAIFSCIPYICSELFFCDEFPRAPSNVYVLCIANDRWFSCNYMQQLMFLTAQYKAILWQRNIIYVSHTRGCVITKKGICYDLVRPDFAVS